MPEPKVATAITYAFDDRNILWMQFFDIRGALICVAAVPEDGAATLGDYIDERLFSDEEDGIGEVVGHA